MYDYKVCNKCRRILPRTSDFFFKQKLGKDGLESQCKDCVKVRYLKDGDLTKTKNLIIKEI